MRKERVREGVGDEDTKVSGRWLGTSPGQGRGGAEGTALGGGQGSDHHAALPPPPALLSLLLSQSPLPPQILLNAGIY